MIVALAHSLPLLWRELAKSVPGRSNKDWRRRWWNSLADGTAKGSWSEEEDGLLIEAVRKHGTNWSRVARVFRSRNSDQCSSHWSQVLDPEINFCDWTIKEVLAVNPISKSWSLTASRTNNYFMQSSPMEPIGPRSQHRMRLRGLRLH